MSLQDELKALIKCNDQLHEVATNLHRKAVERIEALEEGLTEIKKVASISEGTEFYAHLADTTLGFNSEKRKKAKDSMENLVSLTYGEHVWSDDDDQG